MKNKISLYTLFVILLISMQSCAAIGGIFKAGTAFGIIIAVVVIALIIYLLSKAFKNK
jgi:low affinity Fe/Cu permease